MFSFCSFYARRCASVVHAVVVCPPVRPSVRLSQAGTRAQYQNG